jgi:hypothetical protein
MKLDLGNHVSIEDGVLGGVWANSRTQLGHDLRSRLWYGPLTRCLLVLQAVVVHPEYGRHVFIPTTLP